MKNRNLFIGLLSIFSIICAINIGFTTQRLMTESELSEMSIEERYKWMKDEDNFNGYKRAVNNSLSLGLDLQGGMYVTMQIGVDDILLGLAGRSVDDNFRKAMEKARQNAKSSQSNFVDVFVSALKEVNPNAKLGPYFGGQSTGLSYNATDQEVIAKLKTESEDAVERSFNIIRTRIDQFGVASPNLQKVPGTGRILIELPGVRDAERVRKLLRGTAQLEFWPTYTIQQVAPSVNAVNEKLKQIKAAGGDISNLPTSAPEVKATPKDSLVKADTTQKDVVADGSKKDTAKTDTAKASNSKSNEGPLFSLLKPLPPDQTSASSPEVGTALVSDTAEINRIFRNPEIRSLLPEDLDLRWSAKAQRNDKPNELSLIAIKSNKDKIAPLGGETVTDTRPDKDPNTNQNMVMMYMNSDGARIWKNMTTEYQGKSIAVVLDDLVYTYPTVQSVIANGSSQITGNFTVDEAKDLANILKAGKLPAPARIEGEEVVGPTLGAETIQKGMLSFLLGFAVVVLFAALYYKKAGLIADFALIINLFFIVGISSALNVVLTLPGIAGIVLTMGMAVDANVLIYERIREELELGKSLKGAIAAGFRNAFSAIIDGNVTVFLTGVILFIFGTGPIRGFAVTLMIGIITTLITGLMVTRLIVEYQTRNPETADISFGNPAALRFFKRLNIEFIKNRKRSYMAAIVLSMVFIGAFATMGFKLGVDFLGGRQYVVQFDAGKSVDVEQARAELTKVFDNNMPIIKTVGNKNQLMITTNYLYDQQDADKKVEQAVLSGLAFTGANPTILKNTTVGPTVAEDIKSSATKAVVFSLVIMFIYIFIRFQRWQFGMGAVVSLGFNVLFVLGVFSILSKLDLPFSVEIDQNIIAAVLTIVGYTINDTVVVFDRIREKISERTDLPLDELFNSAIVDTLSRTLVTAVSTLASSFILFFFGGEVLQGFMFAMILGIIIGTFSSILIASPVSLDLIKSQGIRSLSEEEDVPPPGMVSAVGTESGQV